jgi:terminase large subunit-like protein
MRHTLRYRVERLEAWRRDRTLQGQRHLLRGLADPAELLRRAGLTPDPWQRQVLGSAVDRLLLLASRQAGKSSVPAALALHTALTRPGAPVLLLSPSTRQSGELFRKVMDLFSALRRPVAVVAESALRVQFGNGSRVLALPAKEGTVRGFSDVALLVVDEAARVPDELYYAVRPMLAVSRGRLVALSTPFGKRGWFHEAWYGDGNWERVKVTAPECQRISAEFLEEERRALGERWYRQEYLVSFEDVVDAVFAYADIQAALSAEVKPLF